MKIWDYDKLGNRCGAKIAHSSKKETADLISSTYFNPSTETETLYCITFDLDAHRADICWKDQDGKLDWGKMGSFLFLMYPWVRDRITFSIRSTGGKGLALMIAITPMELVDSTESNQRLAKAVQKKIFLLLNHHGMGADEAALGLKRDFPNWQNPNKIVDGEEYLLKAIQSDKNRPAILSELIKELNKLPFCSDYIAKKGNEEFLYPDLRVESKFAALYLVLLEKMIYEEEYTVELTTKEVMLITGVSEKTALKMLNSGLFWLNIEYLGKGQGWRLTISPDTALTARAEALVGKKAPQKAEKKIDVVADLKSPEKVEDGERNEWITKLCLILKHSGVDRSQALILLNKQIVRIEGHRYSRNCRNAARILLNIYNNRPESFGCKADILTSNDRLMSVLNPLGENTLREYGTKL